MGDVALGLAGAAYVIGATILSAYIPVDLGISAINPEGNNEIQTEIH